MNTLSRGFALTKYFLRFWMRKTGILYRFMPPKRRLDDLTQNLIWSWWRFREVLITLGQIGPGGYIPASHRPNYVHLDGLMRDFTELRDLSRKRGGLETSRAVFVDRGRDCLVFSGKTGVGTEKTGRLYMNPQPGRESFQIPIMTIHVHPGVEASRGLSDVDYVTFLSDPCQVAMVMIWEGGTLFALKTTATSEKIQPEIAQSRVSGNRKDTLENPWMHMNWEQALLAFNKAVCTDFGLTLYEAAHKSNMIARRIDVTR